MSAQTNTTFRLDQLGCANCASKMERRIQALPGVAEATITFATKQLRISAQEGSIAVEELQRICSSIEPDVKVIPQQSEKKSSSEKQKEEAPSKDLWFIAGGAILFAAAMLLQQTVPQLYLPLIAVSYLLLGGEVLMTAAKNIVSGHVFDENFLMSVATIGAFVIGEYPEAAGVMLFFRIGEYFEDRAVEKSRRQIMDAVDLRPEVVNQIHGDHTHIIPAGEAAVGDILLVRPGDRIPLDGVITEGSSRIDTSPITGEPVPVSVGVGQTVTSGCINTSGAIKIRVEKVLKDSMVSRILDSVENAAANKPKIDRFITRFARIYTPIVVLAALATAIIPSLITGNWDYWVYTALTFLVISCPCALVLSVPLAFFSGIGAGSRRGVLFKGGSAIEAISKVKAVVMDKTGTITKGNFAVQDTVTFSHISKEELLRLAAICEQSSTHPIGVSIVTAYRESNAGESVQLSGQLEEIAGKGISAALPEGHVLCGNRALMESQKVLWPEASKSAEEPDGTIVYVAVDGELAGYLIISDTIKEDSASAIRSLKQSGIATAMLTGDSQSTAESVGSQLGIDLVYSRLLPDEKLEKLREIREKYGEVMFVGDGINDAPVLAGADVGAAMGSGADAAIEAADIVFMTSSLDAVPLSINLAKLTGRIAKQNVIFSLIIKAIVMVLGLSGFASMWMAVFADSGVAMLCVLNAVRILYKK